MGKPRLLDGTLPTTEQSTFAEFSAQRQAELPVDQRRWTEVDIRDGQVAQLLARIGLELPAAPKLIENVVAKISSPTK